VFDLSARIGKEFGETIATVKAAEMLDLVDTPKDDVLMTQFGWYFLAAPSPARKTLFRQAIMKLRLFQMLTTRLAEAPNGRIDADSVLEELGTSILYVISLHHQLPTASAQPRIAVECSATQGHAKEQWHTLVHTSRTAWRPRKHAQVQPAHYAGRANHALRRALQGITSGHRCAIRRRGCRARAFDATVAWSSEIPGASPHCPAAFGRRTLEHRSLAQEQRAGATVAWLRRGSDTRRQQRKPTRRGLRQGRHVRSGRPRSVFHPFLLRPLAPVQRDRGNPARSAAEGYPRSALLSGAKSADKRFEGIAA
jgi:hypothetical protein